MLGVMSFVALVPGVIQHRAILPGIIHYRTPLPGVISFAALVPGVVNNGALLPPAIGPYIGIKFVRLPCTAGNVTPQGLGFLAALFCFLAQPCSVNLRLLGVRARPDGFGLTFTGVNFHVLG